MRCPTAAILALAMHPRYRQQDRIMEEAMKMAEIYFKRQIDYDLLMSLPVENIYAIVDPEIHRIVKTQRLNGLWKIKDSKRISYGILKALKRSGHLEILLNDGRFRHDPFISFRDEKDYYGFVVRRNIIEAPLPDDLGLMEQLASDIFNMQDAGGSWNNTVISTSNHIETLMELGINADSSHIQKGASWLLSACLEDAHRISKVMSGYLVAHNMFSAQERYAEYESALAEKPEWKPVRECYMHLPVIQTGIAIKTLIRLGFENDERVIAACENLLELKRTYGGWCSSNIRTGLIAKQKAGQLR